MIRFQGISINSFMQYDFYKNMFLIKLSEIAVSYIIETQNNRKIRELKKRITVLIVANTSS